MKTHEQLGFIEVSLTDGATRWINADSIETIESASEDAKDYNGMLYLHSGKLVLTSDFPEDIFNKLKVIQEGNEEPVIGFTRRGDMID